MRRVLNRLGITGARCGQAYTECAVTAVRSDRTLLTSITTRLYPLVAQKLGVSPKAVGRGIGYSLQCCWEAGNRALLEEIAGRRLTACPYPREFIAILADYLDAAEQKGAAEETQAVSKQ